LFFARKRIPYRDVFARGHRERHAIGGALGHKRIVAEKAGNCEGTRWSRNLPLGLELARLRRAKFGRG
jgi:hypothetical protein